jgi:hypothetical protein
VTKVAVARSLYFKRHQEKTTSPDRLSQIILHAEKFITGKSDRISLETGEKQMRHSYNKIKFIASTAASVYTFFQ